jgi:hypothetical protein
MTDSDLKRVKLALEASVDALSPPRTGAERDALKAVVVALERICCATKVDDAT